MFFLLLLLALLLWLWFLSFYLFIVAKKKKKLVEMIKRREREQGKYFNKRAQQQQKEKSHLIRDFLSLSLDLTKKDERTNERERANETNDLKSSIYYKNHTTKYFCRLNNCDIVIYPLLFVSYCIYRSKQQKNDFIILLTNVVGLIVVCITTTTTKISMFIRRSYQIWNKREDDLLDICLKLIYLFVDDDVFSIVYCILTVYIYVISEQYNIYGRIFHSLIIIRLIRFYKFVVVCIDKCKLINLFVVCFGLLSLFLVVVIVWDMRFDSKRERERESSNVRSSFF